MVSIDGTDITGATIDGESVTEITIDGTKVWGPSIAVSTISSQNITSDENADVRLNGDLTELENISEAVAYFQWRESGASSWNTTPQENLTNPSEYYKWVDIKPETDYEFRAYTDSNNPSGYSDAGGIQTFSSGPYKPSGAIAKYEFEQDLTDSWNNNDASYRGPDTWDDLPYSSDSAVGNYSADFGTYDSESINVPFQLSNRGDFSIAFWCKTDDVDLGDKRQYLVDESPGSDGLYFYINDYNNMNWVVDTGNNSHVINTPNEDGVWTHYVGTWSGYTTKLYKNGSLVNEISGIGGSISTTSDNIDIGSESDGGYDYSGLLDDFRFYDNDISETEVSNLYNHGNIGGYNL